ncbi:MAG: aspartate-semialdehyde dehydrogenase [bacterium]
MPASEITVAVLGATGRVGRVMLSILEERDFPCARPRLFASSRSAGSTMRFRGEDLTVEDVARADLEGIGIALFSAGGGTSREWAPRFAEAGAVVVDNSSAWRMDPEVPLVVPEVNPDAVLSQHRIIANPNCSTIQLVVVLVGLQRHWGLERVVVSTYQSVSGAGEKGVREYEAQRDARSDASEVMGRVVHENVVPWIGTLGEDDYTEEELKVERESQKILGLPALRVTCTAVRVPVITGHSEAVTVQLSRDTTVSELRKALAALPGVVVMDEPAARQFPTPRETAGRDEVFVGRIRPDRSASRSWNLWVVGDNIRKGAALNAVQIAELLVRQGQVVGG